MQRLMWICAATALGLLGCASPEHQMSRAIEHGEVDEVRALIHQGCDVNGAYRGQTFVRQALEHPAILATLLEAGATADEDLFQLAPPAESGRILLNAGICPKLTTLADLVNHGQADLVGLIARDSHCRDQVHQVYETMIKDGENLDHDMLTLLNPDHRRVFVDHLLDELQQKVDEGTLDTDDMERFAQRFPEYARQEHTTLFSLLEDHEKALKDLEGKKLEEEDRGLDKQAMKGLLEYTNSLAELWLLDPCVVRSRISNLCDEETNYYLAAAWESAIKPVKWSYSEEHGVVAIPITEEEIERSRVRDQRGYISSTIIGTAFKEQLSNMADVNRPFSGGFVIEEKLGFLEDGRITRPGEYTLLVQSTPDAITYRNNNTGFDVHVPILKFRRRPSDPHDPEQAQALKAYFEDKTREERHQQQLKDAEARCDQTLQAISRHLLTPAAVHIPSTPEPEAISGDASPAPDTPMTPVKPQAQPNQADPDKVSETEGEAQNAAKAQKTQQLSSFSSLT